MVQGKAYLVHGMHVCPTGRDQDGTEASYRCLFTLLIGGAKNI
jgi:hypothetical protein